MRNRNRRSIAEINVVPYVDVMLVLLVIFMVTTPLMMQGVMVDLPQANAEPLKVEAELPVIVTVDKVGKLYLSINDKPNENISQQTLVAEVMAARQLNPQRTVLVRGDRLASYQEVLNAMAVLQQAGVPSVSLETSVIEHG